jgi:hypothetical protein
MVKKVRKQPSVAEATAEALATPPMRLSPEQLASLGLPQDLIGERRKLDEGRRLLDQHLARRDGVLPPAWAAKLLKAPEEVVAPPPTKVPLSSDQWVDAEVKRMRAAGEIHTDMKAKALAQELARRMQKAAKRGECRRAIAARSIENMLTPSTIRPKDL